MRNLFSAALFRQYFSRWPVCGNAWKRVLAGYKVVGVKATLTDGSYHEVDSKEIAFKAAARLAYKAGMPSCRFCLSRSVRLKF
ncbi:MAG: hypothetical protein ACLSA6_08870 [Holdemania massiliensis]